jgi:glycosyltransferase involved in cell wall biosynthesis
VKTPLVTVTCITFNHEAYIADALEGIINQKTSFPFEVLVHDDASTDQTGKVVREYARRHPGLIRPIIQSVNQFTQGIHPFFAELRRARGSFVAFCEGDDYWTADDKLERQVDALRQAPDVNICFHRAVAIDVAGREPTFVSPDLGHERKLVPLRQIITGGAGLMPTPTVMVKTSAVRALPPFFMKAPIGDYLLQVYAGSRGTGALYLPETMAAFRRNVIGSATEVTRVSAHSLERSLSYYERLSDCLTSLADSLGGVDAVMVEMMRINGLLQGLSSCAPDIDAARSFLTRMAHRIDPLSAAVLKASSRSGWLFFRVVGAELRAVAAVRRLIKLI